MTEKTKSTEPTSIRGGGYPASNTPASGVKPPPPGMVSKETCSAASAAEGAEVGLTQPI